MENVAFRISDRSRIFHSLSEFSSVLSGSFLLSVKCKQRRMFVSYAVSLLYCQCQKHKHLGFSNVRFRRRSIVKSVCVIVVVAVSLHHQQSDNFCKIQKKNAKWIGAVIYVGHFISSGAPVYVCYTALRSRGACPLQGYWLLSLFTWSTLTSILFVRGTGRY